MSGQALLPRGFRAAGHTCGIKASGKSDLALFVADSASSAAGVFTTNRVCGAPVIVSRRRVPSGSARA
ncbi:MAG: bifunctional ornithine acetyltransferase/N-acetylglutamate synthase, partial [Planctomycetaceae bacterium]